MLGTPKHLIPGVGFTKKLINYNLPCATCSVPVKKLGNISKTAIALATPWNCMLGNILFYLEYLNSHKSRDDIMLGSCAWSIWSSKEVTCALHFPIKGQATVAGQVKILLQAKSYTLWWKPLSYLMGREILHSWYWQVLFHRKKLCFPFRALHILIAPPRTAPLPTPGLAQSLYHYYSASKSLYPKDLST